MSRFRHLLVDLDGTLLGSRDLPLRSRFILEAVRESKRGFFRTFKALHAMRVALEESETGILNETRACRAFGRELGLPEPSASELLKRIVRNTFPRLESYFFPVPGALDFITWAKDHHILHLATNPIWPREIVELRLNWAGIDPALFQSVANAETMHSCKPSPRYYQELLDTLNLNASECLMIGDSLKKDLPANRIGIPVFLLGKETIASTLNELAWRGNFFALRSFLEEK